MTSKNAVEWHTSIATEFDAGYRRSENFKERFSIFSELIESYSDSSKNVIDLGCGAGIFSLFAASLNRHVTGIDGSDAMIAIGKSKIEAGNLNNVDFLVKDITLLAKDDITAADLIICSSVLEYLEYLEKAIDVLDTLLKPGGTLIVSMPNRSSIYRKIEKMAFILFGKPKYYQFVRNVVTTDEMISLLGKKGISTKKICYFSNSPIFSKLLSSDSFKKWTKNLFVLVATKSCN